MAKRIKTEDLINAFLEASEQSIERLKSIENILPKVEKRLIQLQRTELDINTAPAEKLYQQMKADNETFLKNLNADNEKAQKTLKRIIEEHQSRTQKSTEKNQKDLLYHYIAIFVYLLFTTGVLSYGITQHHKRKEAEKTNQLYLREIRVKNLFLKESELEGSFEEWLDGKRK